MSTPTPTPEPARKWQFGPFILERVDDELFVAPAADPGRELRLTDDDVPTLGLGARNLAELTAFLETQARTRPIAALPPPRRPPPTRTKPTPQPAPALGDTVTLGPVVLKFPHGGKVTLDGQDLRVPADTSAEMRDLIRSCAEEVRDRTIRDMDALATRILFQWKSVAEFGRLAALARPVVRKRIVRDGSGAIVEIIEEPAEPAPAPTAALSAPAPARRWVTAGGSTVPR